MTADFAARAQEIGRAIMAVDLDRSPRVALLVIAADAHRRRHMHREPIHINVPDDMLALKEFANASPAERAQFRRGVRLAVLNAAARMVAAAVRKLPDVQGSLCILDAELEVVYP